MSDKVLEKMMNLTLHIQQEKEVELVCKETGLVLERDPQGVFVGNGEKGLEEAANKVFERVKKDGYKHILIGGSVGLVAKLVKMLVTANLKNGLPEIHLYEFENLKRRDPNTGKLLFEPQTVRKVI